MSGHGAMTRRQDQAIAALLTERTHAEAAARAGVSVATLGRWLLEPAFTAAYREARRQLVEAALGQLQQAAATAVATLTRNLTAARPADQIRAAVAILTHSTRAVEWLDLESRLADLEERLSRRRGAAG